MGKEGLKWGMGQPPSSLGAGQVAPSIQLSLPSTFLFLPRDRFHHWLTLRIPHQRGLGGSACPHPLGHARSMHAGQGAWGAGAGAEQWGRGSAGAGGEAGTHLALEVHVGHVAADGRVVLVPAPALLGVLEAALAQGVLVAGAAHLAHVDGAQA